MILPVTATKTFQEWLIDNPDFYDDYVDAGLIDEATVLSINKWYKYRVICDDYKFTDFFERQLDLTLERYNKLIRLENTEFDALVNVYRERQITDNGSETSSEVSENTRSNNETDTMQRTIVRTPDLTTTDNGQTSSQSHEENEHEDTRTPNLITTDNGSTTSHTESSGENESSTSGSNSTQGMNANVSKQNPQSISYMSGFDSDGMPLLSWAYPSSQNQSKSKSEGENQSSASGSNSSETDGTGSSSNTNTLTGTDVNDGTYQTDNTASGTSQNTNRQTGTETTTDNSTNTKGGSISDEGSVTGSKTKNGVVREQFTGRDGLTPQQALKEAMAYVKNSSAFEWLRNALEICFLSVYDI